MRKFLGKPPVDHGHDAVSLGITSSPFSQLAPAYRPNAAQNAIFQAGAPVACFDRSADGRSVVLAGRHVLKIVQIHHQTIEERADLRASITAQPATGPLSGKAKAGSGVGALGALGGIGGLGGLGGIGGIGAGIDGIGVSAASISDQLSIKDVKWAPLSGGGGSMALFTACANGKIFHYDMSRPVALEMIMIREDSRQINSLDVQPLRGTILLTGSQDGFMRCFDIRSPVASQATGMLTFRHMATAFKCNDSVRFVKWSPRDAFYSACGTDSGVVMKWDLRKTSTPVLRINAHEANRACTGLAWHPDGDHVISAGTDRKCHVWDLSDTADKRQKPKYTISTPAPVSSLAWRPGQWSATSQGKRAAQVAVSYDESSAGGGGRRQGNGVVHIWDLARPTMPYKEIDRFESSPMSLLWHDQDLLWTAGLDGIFSQCDVAFAPKVLDRVPVSSLAFSSRGDVFMCLDERAQPRPHRTMFPPSLVVPHYRHQQTRPHGPHGTHGPHHGPHNAHAHTTADMYPTSPLHGGNTSGSGSSPTAHMLSASRSDSEDDVVGSFLGPRKPRRSRRLSTRSSGALSTTPPSAPGIPEDRIVPLDQSLKLTGLFKTQQSMAVGPVPSPATSKVDVHHFLSTQYLETLERELPFTPGGKPMVERVELILEHYARAAECVSLFRLAQTWRILAFAMGLLLRSRAQYHQARRLGRVKNPMDFTKANLNNTNGKPSTGRNNASGELTPRRSAQHSASGSLSEKLQVPPGRSLLAEEFESTSNVPTPLARPVNDSPAAMPGGEVAHLRFVGKQLTPVLEIEGLSLGPPAVHPGGTVHHAGTPLERRQRLDSTPLSVMSHDSDNTQYSSTEGYDFYDMEAMTHAIDVPQPKGQHRDHTLPPDYVHPRSPGTSASPSRRRSVFRHDSDDSFASMFAISQTTSGGGSITSSPNRRRIAAAAADTNRREQLQLQQQQQQLSSSPGEFRSRIRGKELNSQGSPASSGGGMASSDDVQKTFKPTGALTTQTSDDSDEHRYQLYTQTTIDSSSQSPQKFRLGSYQQHQQHQQLQQRQPQVSRPQIMQPQPPPHPIPGIYTPPETEDESSPNILEGDYLPWPDDPPYPFPAVPLPSSTTTTTTSDKNNNNAAATATTTTTAPTALEEPPTPLQPYAFILRALSFETSSSSPSLNSSAMILLLRPLVPLSLIDPHQASSILRTHHSRLMGMRLFVEAALLRKLCVPGWPGGVLESLWNFSYPAVFAQAQQGVVAAFLCARCKRARDVDRGRGSGDSVWRRCERCGEVVGACAVCGHRDGAAVCVDDEGGELGEGRGGDWDGDEEEDGEKVVIGTWWYCATCAHGGHASCLAIWHAAHLDTPTPAALAAATKAAATEAAAAAVAGDEESVVGSRRGGGGGGGGIQDLSEGCCPVDGCGHACLPGRWRAESTAARTEEVSRAVLREAARAAAASRASRSGSGSAARSGGDGDASSSSPVLHGSGGAISGHGDIHAHAYQQQHHQQVVRGDSNEAVQSRAVESVREALGAGGGAGGGGGSAARGHGFGGGGAGTGGGYMTPLGTSPSGSSRTGLGFMGGVVGGSSSGGGGGSRERERRKSVKFAAGAEERR